jgi:hypothetical protein
MWSKSNPLVVFALDLMFTYEGEHMIFGLLGQANLSQNDVPQFHPFTSVIQWIFNKQLPVIVSVLYAEDLVVKK